MSEAKKRGLGRGLSALLPGGPPTGPLSPPGAMASVPASAATPGSTAGPIASAAAPAGRPRTYFAAGIEELYPSPEQPRRRFDETKLGELADSIKVHGIIVPLVVRPRPSKDGGGYYLIAGERRWRAAQRAGLHEVPVVVQDVEEG